jgi:RNA polymerase sigma-70 factor, ECF subfamily
MGGMTPHEQEREFRSLYKATRQQLIAYALRRTRNSDDAADVVADVYLIAWRRFDTVPRDERMLLWLYATARRVLANRTRQSATRAKVIGRLAIEFRDLADRAGGHDDSLAAFGALRQLSADDREILMLAGWEGLTSAEQACVLGCSVTAARLRLHRARGRLQSAISDWDGSSFTQSPEDLRVPMQATEKA